MNEILTQISDAVGNAFKRISRRGNPLGNPGAHAPAAKVNGKAANKDGIRRVELGDGSVVCDAQVRVKGYEFTNKHGKKVKVLAKRFTGPDAFKDARRWKEDEEKLAREELARIAAEGPLADIPEGALLLTVPFPAAMAKWIDLMKHETKIGLERFEELHYLRLAKHELLRGLRVNQVTEEVVIAYFKSRGITDEAAPSTLLKEWIYWRKAFTGLFGKYRKSTWKAFVNPLNKFTRKELANEELIAESEERGRTFDEDQLQQLRGYFADDKPMLAAMEIANVQALRRGEIERAGWSGFNEAGRYLTVYRKDSAQKKVKGMPRRRQCDVPLVDEAIEIILAQPRIEGQDLIFPTYSGDELGKKLAKACVDLGINLSQEQFLVLSDQEQEEYEFLCFHSLRHTALTRLATNMAAYNIGMPELQEISGHKSVRHLQRYINMGKRQATAISKKLKGFRAIPAQPVAKPEGELITLAA